MSISSFITDKSKSSKFALIDMPALLINTSILLYFSTVLSIKFLQSSIFLTSVFTENASPPCFFSSSSTFFSSLSLRAARTTFAPWPANSYAHAFPMPEDAPVITTTLFLNFSVPLIVFLRYFIFGNCMLYLFNKIPLNTPIFSNSLMYIFIAF